MTALGHCPDCRRVWRSQAAKNRAAAFNAIHDALRLECGMDVTRHDVPVPTISYSTTPRHFDEAKAIRQNGAP